VAPLGSPTQPLTLQQQDRLLRRDWPFRTVLLGDDLALWRGRVYGLSLGYEVAILYVRRPFQANFEYGHAWFPEVRVLAPKLQRRAVAPDTPIPHVYGEASDPVLCLFDPAVNGWDASQTLTATTVPWIGDWLRFYEAWQATGRWHGGGRDHGGAQRPESAQRAPSTRLRRLSGAQGMQSSRTVLATIEARRAGPLDRRSLVDAFRYAGLEYVEIDLPDLAPLPRALAA
jgi:hypothetical protein